MFRLFIFNEKLVFCFYHFVLNLLKKLRICGVYWWVLHDLVVDSGDLSGSDMTSPLKVLVVTTPFGLTNIYNINILYSMILFSLINDE